MPVPLSSGHLLSEIAAFGVAAFVTHPLTAADSGAHPDCPARIPGSEQMGRYPPRTGCCIVCDCSMSRQRSEVTKAQPKSIRNEPSKVPTVSSRRGALRGTRTW